MRMGPAAVAVQLWWVRMPPTLSAARKQREGLTEMPRTGRPAFPRYRSTSMMWRRGSQSKRSSLSDGVEASAAQSSRQGGPRVAPHFDADGGGGGRGVGRRAEEVHQGLRVTQIGGLADSTARRQGRLGGVGGRARRIGGRV
ncbi:hypothetical protein PVAP13_3KG266560 [Panicum virgatum]|uniref:Uncharacterized protein n=1 Tax=Panicum virgatum TaxID=38727 RepID=A0A8T0V7H1_PANVG|nr:hypothetical protein PVAP13_3KG266560 [Panicum virgatum]